MIASNELRKMLSDDRAERNRLRLITVCRKAGLPRVAYEVNEARNVLRVRDGNLTHPFGIGPNAGEAYLKSAEQQIADIAARRLIRINGGRSA